MAADDSHRAGIVAVAGRPNTGKSTLVNALVAEKISIVTPKPQTTRHSIMGIVERPEGQLVFVDTPGLHHSGGRRLNRVLNRNAGASIAGADLALLLIDARGWRDGDEFALRQLERSDVPVVLAINKIDLVRPRAALLPLLEESAGRHDFLEIVPISARRGENLERLLAVLLAHLPPGPPLFPPGQKTDRGLDFRVAEIIREKLLLALREEVPYGIAVQVERMESDGDLLRIEAVIWVERRSHRGIVIGRGGRVLKQVGQAARAELECLLGRKVYLQTHVKLRENWSDNEAALRQLGYDPCR